MRSFLFAGAFAALAGCTTETVIDFGTFDLPAEGFLDASTAAPAFDVDGVRFNTYFDDTYGLSSGFSVSSLVDTTTEGYTNALSVFAGEDFDGNGQFAVWNPPFGLDGTAIDFPEDSTVTSVQVANNTYAALSMTNGDQFAKAFTAEDEDFFTVIFTGLDADGEELGTVEFPLADFRPENNVGILDTWAEVDLTPRPTSRT